MNTETPRYASLSDYLLVLRKYWLLILIPMLLAGGSAYFFSKRIKPSYQATAIISLQDATQSLTLLGTSVTPGSAVGPSPLLLAQTLNSLALANAVKRSLHTSQPAFELQSGVALSVQNGTGFLNVTTRAREPRFAARLANAFAVQAVKSITNSQRRQFGDAENTLRKRKAALDPAKPADQGALASLEEDISRLEFLRSTLTPAQLARPAAAPTTPVSPHPLRNAGLGLLAGMVIGLILSFVRDALDPRLRGSAAIVGELGYPLLGQLRAEVLGRTVQPSAAGQKKLAGDVDTFRILRRNVEQLLADKQQRTVLITSAVPEEGKSTVAASLALAAAVTGRRALLIDADLRRPSLASRLDLPSSPGLSEYLAGLSSPKEILKTVPVALPSPATDGAAAGAPADTNPLVCITAGAPSSQSSELLGSELMRNLLTGVSDVYDLVIVDTSPLLPVADTLELLPSVRGVVLCVRSGRATRAQARAAKAALNPYPEHAIGIVVTGLRPQDERTGYGLYPYDYSHATRVEPSAEAPGAQSA